jgi:hypothetical protein
VSSAIAFSSRGKARRFRRAAWAKVLSSAIGEGHIVLTVEAGAAIELHSFDLKTLRPLGSVRLAPKP